MSYIQIDTSIVKGLHANQAFDINARVGSNLNALLVIPSVQDSQGAIHILRSNENISILPSAVRNATINTDRTEATLNRIFKGMYFILDVTAASGTGGLTPRFCLSDVGHPIFLNPAITPITTIGRHGFLIYPGATLSGDLRQVISMPLPFEWFIQITHLDASNYTYSITGQLML